MDRYEESETVELKDTLHIIELAEKVKTFRFVQNDKLRIILRKLNKAYPDFCVFGSYAENMQRDYSDLDIVVFDEDKKIEFDCSITINPKFISFDEFRRLLSEGNALAKEIAKKHVIFGNISRFVSILGEWYNE